MNDDTLKLDLGLIVVEALPAPAFKGFANRVHATEKAAIVDIAQNTLADRWLSKEGLGKPTFQTFMDLLCCDLELSEAAIKLARYRLDCT